MHIHTVTHTHSQAVRVASKLSPELGNTTYLDVLDEQTALSTKQVLSSSPVQKVAPVICFSPAGCVTVCVCYCKKESVYTCVCMFI